MMNLIKLIYLDRARSYAPRIIELLNGVDVESKFNQEVSDYEKKLNEYDLDIDSAYDLYIQKQSSLADELSLFQDSLYASALSSFFHLWERDVRQLCKRLLRQMSVTDDKGKLIKEKDIEKFYFDKIKEFLIAFGASEESFKEIEKLHVIVNVIKHSKGSASDTLRRLDYNYYKKLAHFCELDINFGDISDLSKLEIEDVKYFGQAVIDFWENLSKEINV